MPRRQPTGKVCQVESGVRVSCGVKYGKKQKKRNGKQVNHRWCRFWFCVEVPVAQRVPSHEKDYSSTVTCVFRVPGGLEGDLCERQKNGARVQEGFSWKKEMSAVGRMFKWKM